MSRRPHNDEVRDIRTLQRQRPASFAPTRREFQAPPPVRRTRDGRIVRSDGIIDWFLQSEEDFAREQRSKHIADTQWKEQVDEDARKFLSWQNTAKNVPVRPAGALPRARPNPQQSAPPTGYPPYPNYPPQAAAAQEYLPYPEAEWSPSALPVQQPYYSLDQYGYAAPVTYVPATPSAAVPAVVPVVSTAPIVYTTTALPGSPSAAIQYEQPTLAYPYTYTAIPATAPAVTYATVTPSAPTSIVTTAYDPSAAIFAPAVSYPMAGPVPAPIL